MQLALEWPCMLQGPVWGPCVRCGFVGGFVVRICSEVLKAILLREGGRTPQVCAWGGLWNLVPGFRPRGSQKHGKLLTHLPILGGNKIPTSWTLAPAKDISKSLQNLNAPLMHP